MRVSRGVRNITYLSLLLLAAALASCGDDEEDSSDACTSDFKQIGLTLANVDGVAASRGSVAYYARCGGVWVNRTPEDEESWLHLPIGCTEVPSSEYHGLLSVAVDDSFVYVATGRVSALPKMINRHSLFSSEGEWTKADSGIPSDTVLSLLSLPDGTLWAVTANYGYYVSLDRGRTWQLGALSGSVLAARLVQQDNALLTYGEGSFFVPFLDVSYDLGETWDYLGLNDDAAMISAAFSDQDSSQFLIVLEIAGVPTLRELDYPRGETRDRRVLPRFGDMIARPAGKVTVLADSLYTFEYSDPSWTGSSDPTNDQFGQCAVDWSSGTTYSWEGSIGSYRAIQLCR